MNKIIGVGVEQIDKHEYQIRQYEKALDQWQERADQEHQACYEKQGLEPNIKEWRGLLHILAKLKLDAFVAGIKGDKLPNTANAIDCMAMQLSDDPMGVEFFKAVEESIIRSYTHGQEARR